MHMSNTTSEIGIPNVGKRNHLVPSTLRGMTYFYGRYATKFAQQAINIGGM